MTEPGRSELGFELLDGETVLWEARPPAWRVAMYRGAYWSLASLLVLFLGLLVLMQIDGVNEIFPVFIIGPVLMIGIAGLVLYLAFRRMRRGERVAYAVTDRRVLIHDGERGLQTVNVTPSTRIVWAKGEGTGWLLFNPTGWYEQNMAGDLRGIGWLDDAYLRAQYTYHPAPEIRGFYWIDDPEAVGRLIRSRNAGGEGTA